jgi:signal recognition particle subunit SRP54
MVGLHGAGKTTSSGKLARLIQKQGRQALLVAADVYRPAAMDQLETLGKQLEIPTFVKRGESDVLKIAREALEYAKANSRNTIIFDTAGRLQIDEPLVQELVRLRDLVKPQEILLVLDAATGQEAVNVATHFDQALSITGSILTKLDGDARGGAALSMKSVTGKPIKFAGVGEKLEDFLELLRQMKKLGPLENIVKMLPGGAEAVKGADLGKQEKEFKRMEALICGMTLKERKNPTILNASRRRRIAAGSGASVTELNTLLNKFSQMQQMMKKMGKFQKMMARMGGGMPGMFRR